MEDKLILLLNRGAGKNVKTVLEETVHIISSENIYKRNVLFKMLPLQLRAFSD